MSRSDCQSAAKLRPGAYQQRGKREVCPSPAGLSACHGGPAGTTRPWGSTQTFSARRLVPSPPSEQLARASAARCESHLSSADGKIPCDSNWGLGKHAGQAPCRSQQVRFIFISKQA
eukprot:765650-Hanusia_phi.AAC.1